jgi:hypothetical protein
VNVSIRAAASPVVTAFAMPASFFELRDDKARTQAAERAFRRIC